MLGLDLGASFKSLFMSNQTMVHVKGDDTQLLWGCILLSLTFMLVTIERKRGNTWYRQLWFLSVNFCDWYIFS